MNRELLQQALDLAESTNAYHGLIDMLKAELAKPEPKPVARLLHWTGGSLLPSGRVCAKTFEEYPVGTDKKTAWSEGAPLYASEPSSTDGMVPVPVEPTEGMLNASLEYITKCPTGPSGKYHCNEIYKAMIEAAKEQK